MTQTPVHSTRAARRLDAVTVRRARVEAARAQAEAENAAQLARLEVERQLRRAEAERRAGAEADRARRRAARAARRADRRQALVGRGPLLVTLGAITLFVVVALPAQVSFLAQRWPLPMALAGGLALEILTWVFAVQGRTREARGHSAAAHHGAVWCAATVAAGINLAHGAAMWGVDFAVVAAAGSLAAPLVWHFYLFAQRDHGQTPAEARRWRRRRHHHRRVVRAAEQIAAAIDLPAEDAFRLAWRAEHGAEPGITAELLDRRREAVQTVMRYLRPGEGATLEALARPVVREVDARAVVAAGLAAARPVAELRADSVYETPALPHTGPYMQLTSRTGGRTEPRTPAVQAVQAPPPDDAELSRKRRRAREDIRRILATGDTPSPTQIGRAYLMSPEWGAKQIRAVRAELDADDPTVA